MDARQNPWNLHPNFAEEFADICVCITHPEDRIAVYRVAKERKEEFGKFLGRICNAAADYAGSEIAKRGLEYLPEALS